MFRVALLFALLALASTQTSWVITWQDEFSDSDTLNTTKWNFDIGSSTGWPQYWTDNNTYISNGKLIIEARQESVNGFNYTSASLSTQGLFSTTYGKFEISAQLPSGTGMWPYFWLFSDNSTSVGVPACAIGILDFHAPDPEDVHGTAYGTGPTGFTVTDTYYLKGGFSSGFHTYGAIWQPDMIQFYVDGDIYLTVTPSQTDGHWPFTQSMFMELGLSVGPDPSAQFPQQFIIDYARVYEPAAISN